jgi:hypothetical protein
MKESLQNLERRREGATIVMSGGGRRSLRFATPAYEPPLRPGQRTDSSLSEDMALLRAGRRATGAYASAR